MEPFDKLHWSRLQVEMWVCTRNRDAVRLADHAPGRTRFADLRPGPDGIDDEKHDGADPSAFDHEDDLICTAITRYGYVCPWDDARKEVVVALSEGQLRAYSDPSTGSPS
jgi:hypothetical protein